MKSRQTNFPLFRRASELIKQNLTMGIMFVDFKLESRLTGWSICFYPVWAGFLHIPPARPTEDRKKQLNWALGHLSNATQQRITSI